MCGQIFDQSVGFCPKDGSRLPDELVSAQLHEMITFPNLADQPAKGEDRSDFAEAAEKIERNVPRRLARQQNPKSGNNGDQKEPTLPSLSRNSAKLKRELTPVNTNAGMLPVGSVVAQQYEILSLIGKGGMSYVYKAKHLLLNKVVAIKTLLPHLMSQSLSLQRFQQEAKAASNLKHANIIAVFDFGTTDDGEPFLVMDYIEGISLADEIVNERHIHVDRAVGIFLQIADALYHAHQKGVIHRDLKPSNVILLKKEGQDDYVNIVDFGIAKMLPQEGSEAINLTQTGDVFGSPLYMSPEQARGEKLDARADIYSMGCMMYETLTGRHVVSGDNTMEVLYNHIHSVPDPLNDDLVRVPSSIEKIVFKTLAKDPAQRYQTMAELHAVLEAYERNRKSNFLGKISDRWSLFWLRRKPRTLREKMIASMLVISIFSTLALSVNLGTLYWTAAASPDANTPIVWQEDLDQSEPLKGNLTNKMRISMALLNASGMERQHEDQNDIINTLLVTAESLAKEKLWAGAAALYKDAADRCHEYNGDLSLKTFTLYIQLAHCYFELHRYDDAKAIYLRIGRILRSEVHRDVEDQGLIASRLGVIDYFEKQYPNAIIELQNAANIWTKQITCHEAHTHFFTLPEDCRGDYDYGAMISRLATANQRVYERSETDGAIDTTALKASVNYYRMALGFWSDFNDDHRSKMNAAVAAANLLKLEHALDRNKDLSEEYADNLQENGRFSVFPRDSVYRAMMLKNQAAYLLDKGDWISAIKARLQAWRILSERAKKSDTP